MAVLRRGVKNALRNVIRTVSITVILALVVALAVVMMLSRQAVGGRIEQVQGQIGTTITVTPAGSRGFAGGGEPMTAEQLATVAATPHVTAVARTLSDRVSTAGSTSGGPGASANANATTNLVSAIDAGALGRRFGGGGGGQDGAAGGGQNGAPAGTGRQSVPQGQTGQTGQTGQPFSLPISVTGTSDPTSTQVSGVGTFTLTAGDAFDGMGDEDVAIVGTTLAEKNSLAPGATFTMYDHTITVVGVFDTANTFANAGVIVPLATLQRLSGQTGSVTSALAKVDSIGNVASTTTALQAALGTAADVVSDATNAESAMSSLDSVRTISTYSMVGALVAGAVILFLSMLMIVRERRREIGVLKAIGASNGTISLQFIAEALTLTLLAGIVGLAISVVLSNPVLDVMVTSNNEITTQQVTGPFGGQGRGAANATGPAGQNGPRAAAAGARQAGQNGGGFRPGAFGRGVTQFGTSLDGIKTSVGFGTLLYGLLIAVAIAVVGSAFPSYLIARVRPAEVMRSE